MKPGLTQSRIFEFIFLQVFGFWESLRFNKFDLDFSVWKWPILETKPEEWTLVGNSNNPTVVKWGHTEGIEREKTSSQNSQGIALNFEFILVIQIWG